VRFRALGEVSSHIRDYEKFPQMQEFSCKFLSPTSRYSGHGPIAACSCAESHSTTVILNEVQPIACDRLPRKDTCVLAKQIHSCHELLMSPSGNFPPCPSVPSAIVSCPESLQFLPQFCPRILGIQSSEFSQQFLGLFVPRHGNGHLDLHNLIAACALFHRRRHALFAQP